MINAKKNPPFNCYLKQNFYLKGEIPPYSLILY